MHTPEQKRHRFESCNENSEHFKHNACTLLSRVVTGDDMWVSQWDLEAKHETMQLKHMESPTQYIFHV
jgi:hypothetical protein